MDAIKSLKKLEISTISDALDEFGINGGCKLIPRSRGTKVVGRAFTVKFEKVKPGTFAKAADYIDDVNTGEIIVIDNDGDETCTVWGEILTKVAINKKISGTIISGACRDVSEISKLKYPLFSSGVFMKTGKNRAVLSYTQKPVSIGETIVNPGDYVIGDESGVLVIPYGIIDKVIAKAQEITKKEQNIIKSVNKGVRLKEEREMYNYSSLPFVQKMEMMDVTLRESVFCNNPITMDMGLSIIEKLAQINIDYIEIGYLKKDAVSDSNFFNYDRNYIEKAYSIIDGKSKISAMIHPEDFYSNNWDMETLKKISMIRICFNANNDSETIPMIKYFHELGIRVSLNLTHVSCYSLEQCMDMAEFAEKNGADLFYVADSNGNLLPEDVEQYVGALVEKFKGRIGIGFHAHDNLGLAQINAIKALEKGAEIIDSSIMGFGKGAGNLRTELFPMLLTRKKVTDKKYNFKDFFDLANYFNQNITKTTNFEEQYKFSLYGMMNAGLEEDDAIKKESSAQGIKDYELAFLHANKCECDLQKFKKSILISKLFTK